MECVKCGTTENLTEDHIVPRWLWTRLSLFGLGHHSKADKTNKQTMCFPCNKKKNSKIDFSHPLVRQKIQELVDHLQNKLKE